jgi:hypothetical protein
VPARPAALPGRPWARAEATQRVIDLWTQLIDPSTNGVDSAARLGRMRLFTRMAPGDSPLAWPDPDAISTRMLGDLLGPGGH